MIKKVSNFSMISETGFIEYGFATISEIVTIFSEI
jgi:hypothetical protein